MNWKTWLLTTGFALAGTMAIMTIKTNSTIEVQRPLRVALAGELPSSFVPEDISTVAAYHVNSNVWGTLVRPGGKSFLGRLISISSDRTKYEFAMTEGTSFSNGRLITPEDVVFSFNRLIKIEKSGHFKAKDILKKVSVRAENVVLELNRPTPSFLYLLSTPEFGIIPWEAVGAIDLTISESGPFSGPYKITKVSRSNKKVFLEKNAYYKQVFLGPDKLEILFGLRFGPLADAILRGEIDFAEVIDSKANETLAKVSKNESFAHNETRPSVSVFLVRNDKYLTAEQGRTFSDLVRKNFFVAGKFDKKSTQILPPKTFGSLPEPTPETRPDLKRAELPKTVIIQIGVQDGPMAIALKQIGEAGGFEVDLVPYGTPGPFHFFYYSQGMNTDHPEIELHLALAGPYAFTKATANELEALRQAEVETNEAERQQLIRALVRSLTDRASFVPLTVRSYLHLYNRDLLNTEGFSDFDGELPFQLLRLRK